MINQLHICNFKCLRDTRLSLEPLTVLIGPNNSGKTTILDAIRTLGRLTIREINDVFSGDCSIENITGAEGKKLRSASFWKGSFRKGMRTRWVILAGPLLSLLALASTRIHSEPTGTYWPKGTITPQS
ncbi:MAG: AAA family ATPase [Myxococcales bacterium]|nr:AAA family ATPase [Polyangiaceae bacterium]MDW8251907.1 AAA family ATPase [Myxococcales bacterium]